MSDPLADVEDKKGQVDLGVMAARVFKGTQSEVDNYLEAYLTTAAFFYGMFKANKDDPPMPDE